METNSKVNTDTTFQLKLLNGLLLLITCILSVVVFFGILEIIVSVANFVLIRTMDSPTQRAYTIITLRNFWMLLGGGSLAMFLIGSLEYHLKRLGNEKTRHILVKILRVEAVIIVLSVIAYLI
jgi:hypothetical protein